MDSKIVLFKSHFLGQRCDGLQNGLPSDSFGPIVWTCCLRKCGQSDPIASESSKGGSFRFEIQIRLFGANGRPDRADIL